MSSDNYTSIGPGKVLAYIRADLRGATQSLLLVGPWLDDYVAEQMLLVAPRNLNARVLVRSEQHMDQQVWGRIVAGLSLLAGQWTNLQARTMDRLHAKCLLVDEQIAYVGSANWYRYSVENGIEIVVRGPLAGITGLQQECESLWQQGQPFQIPTASAPSTKISAEGITHEVLDPLAREVLKENPKAFVLGRKR